jgi:methylphosphotriester-DNA--protein-cysteine methyltransferase
LENNGGPTFTHALLPCSPAIDQGRNFSDAGTDQRGVGFTRSFDDPVIGNATGADGTDIGAFEAQGHLLDSTPPSMTCPFSIAVDFTSETGAMVTFPVAATDPCDPNPSVTCIPASGSTFYIGTTDIECTARDATGNASFCSFSVTVLGARGANENVLADLIALRATVTDRDDGRRLDEAIGHLTQALAAELWADETHLERKHGEKVFQEDKETVKNLCELIKDKKSSIPDAILQQFIDRIFRADRLLAAVTIEEAIAAGVSAKKIEQAQKLVAKGDGATGDDKCDNGIEDYRNAWQHAIRAKVGPPTHLANGHLQLEILGAPGERLVIQASSDLVVWVTIGTYTVNAEGGLNFEDAGASGQAVRYYRTVSQ